MVLGPQCAHYLEHLYVARTAVIKADIVQLEFWWPITDCSAEDGAPIRDNIQHCHVFRGSNRMVKGQHYDISSKQYTAGTGCNPSKSHKWRGPVVVTNAVMFLQPDRVESQLFTVNRLGEGLVEIRAAFCGYKSKFHSDQSQSVR